MLLFAISLLLVFTSSYFLTSIIAPKKSVLGLIYLFLIAFAQIVLTFEVLSLFTSINQTAVLALNSLIFLVSTFIWVKKFMPTWRLESVELRNKIINSLSLDKSLMWLYVGFLVLIIGALILCVIMPLTSTDAQAYHVARSVFWVLQGSVNHFDTPDIRNLCLPINSEILYSWVILFTKKALFLGFFSFVGFILTVVSVYNIMGYLSFSTRRKLWVIFILSSFPSVFVQISGTETDIIIAGLLASSIFLFWYSLKNNRLTPVFMSALAFALAIGTKTTAIIAIPGVGLMLLILSIYYKKYKQLAYFTGFGFLSFLIFSSYNYILNFIQFKNFMGSQSLIVTSKNYYGIKGAFANFIKYIFSYFDFTGLKWSDYVGKDIANLRMSVLSYFGLGSVLDGLYSPKFVVNNTLLEPLMGAGVLGLFIYLPCLLWSLIKPVFKFNSKRTWTLFSFSVFYIVNVFVMSDLLAYMSYNIRFIMFFMVLSSPVLAYSYIRNKSFAKNIIVFFAMYNLLFVSTSLWGRPFVKIVKNLQADHSISHLRYRAFCTNYNKTPIYTNSACHLRELIEKKLPRKGKILLFANEADSLFIVKTLEFSGYKIDYRTMEDFDKINLSDYYYMIMSSAGQKSSLVKNFKGFYRRDIYDENMRVATCTYGGNTALFKLKTVNYENSYPYKVVCRVNNDFLAKEHYKFFDKTSPIKSVPKSNIYFEIYKRVD